MEAGAQMRVRLADDDDMLDILVVRIGSWREAYRGILPQRYLDEMRKSKKLEYPTGTWLVEADKIVAGYLVTDVESFEAIPKSVEIKELYVHPNYWRMGLGTALVDSVSEGLGERGCRELALWVLEANERGRAFYEALGFTRDRRGRKNVPTAGVDLPVVLYRRPT